MAPFPRYDLLATRLLIADDPLALPLGGRDRRLTHRHLFDYGAYCGLPPRAAERILRKVTAHENELVALVASSPLPDDIRSDYIELLRDHGASLRA